MSYSIFSPFEEIVPSLLLGDLLLLSMQQPKEFGNATTEAVKNTQRLNHSIETSISSSNQTINLLSLVLIKNAIVKENIFWLQVQ